MLKTSAQAYDLKSKGALKRIGILGFLLLFLSACASKSPLVKSREAFEKGNFEQAEAELTSSKAIQQTQDRAAQYLQLGTLAFDQAQYEKAADYFQKARNKILEVRGQSGFALMLGNDYSSNAIEFSYLHYYLVLSYSFLAQAATSSQTRNDWKVKARAELLSWDTHLQNLQKTYPDRKVYTEDPLARIVASAIHALSDDRIDQQTSKILLKQAQMDLEFWKKRYTETTLEDSSIVETKVDAPHAQAKQKNTRIVIEAGVLPVLKSKKILIGLSTLFKEIKDPTLRTLVEQIGIRVILLTAPEFGLVMLTGAVGGTISNSGESGDKIEHLSEAIDQGLGFEIKFPELELPPLPQMELEFSSENLNIPLQVACPLQEVLGTDLKVRQKSDFYKEAVKIGLQYLAVLLPAIHAYQNAKGEGSGFKKLLIVAGYMLAKKIIDAAHTPDLRSWSYLPQFIATASKALPQNFDRDLQQGLAQGVLKISTPQGSIMMPLQKPTQMLEGQFLWGRVGRIPLLEKP